MDTLPTPPRAKRKRKGKKGNDKLASTMRKVDLINGPGGVPAYGEGRDRGRGFGPLTRPVTLTKKDKLNLKSQNHLARPVSRTHSMSSCYCRIQNHLAAKLGF